MDSFEWNKIIGAVLGTFLFVLVLQKAAEALFHEEPLAEQAIHIEVPEEAHGGTAELAEGPIDLGRLLAAANPDRGKAIAARCASCHTFEAGGPIKVGPNLHGIVGAKQAHMESFSYSRAMQNAGGTWTYEQLNHFIENPQTTVPGTAMNFIGISRTDQRMDVIAFLRSITDNPPPLPAPLPEPESESSEDVAPAADVPAEPADDTASPPDHN